MIDYMIIMLTQTKVGLGFIGTIAVVAGIFATYYILFAITLIIGSIYSGIKLIPESYRVVRAELAGTYDTAWGDATLGVTMPDGGEPVSEEEEK